MSHPSQIFEVLITNEQYQQIIKEKQILIGQNRKLNEEMGLLKKQLTYVCQNDIKEYKSTIFHLSKKVLQLSKLLLTFKENYDQVKSKLDREKIAKIQLDQQKMEGDLINKMHEERILLENEMQKIRQQNELVRKELQDQKNKTLQYEKEVSQLKKELKIQLQWNSQVKLKLLKSQEQQQQRDYILLNERNFVAQKMIQINSKEAELKNIQQELRMKSDQINSIHQSWQLKVKLKEILLSERERNLQSQLKQKYKQLQLALNKSYEEKIASLKQFTTYEKQIQEIKQQLNKVKVQNVDCMKRMVILKKRKDEFQNQTKYQKEYYESTQYIQNKIIELYANELKIFEVTLVSSQESNVAIKVKNKKNQIVDAFNKKLQQVISSP